MKDRKNKKATLFRLSTFIPIIIILIFVFILFNPNYKMIIAGILSGFTISIHDFIIEYYAFKHDLWYCYGGFQKIGKYNLHVPIDMIILFFIGGFSLGIFSTFPNFIRRLPFYHGILFKNPYLDYIWVFIALVIIALIGASADFISKKFDVWENGKTWTFWKCAFYAWLPLLCLSVFIFQLIFFLLS